MTRPPPVTAAAPEPAPPVVPPPTAPPLPDGAGGPTAASTLGWQLLAADEFDASSVDTARWQIYDAIPARDANTPAEVAVHVDWVRTYL